MTKSRLKDYDISIKHAEERIDKDGYKNLDLKLKEEYHSS
jgi:hypothetical protein